MSNSKFEFQTNSEKGYDPFFLAMMILLFHFVYFIKFNNLILHQITLRDFDGYWHLLRVNDLHNFGNTYHTTLSRSNAPYGESIHWTSAFDLLLYAGAYIGSFFVDFNVALLWWAIIINPFLHVLTFLVLFWGIRDLIGDLRASIFGVIFPFQLCLFGVFDMGVPDHHGAQLFLFSCVMAFVVKSIMSQNWKIFSIGGIIGGISIWFGIESITFVLVAISFFGLLWVLDGKKYNCNNFLFSLMLLLTTFFTLYVDTMSGRLMNIAYDRLSIAHVCLFLIITSFWALVAVVSKWTNLLENINGRIIAAIIGILACVLLMHDLFPLFFKDPLSDVNPDIKLIYLNQTGEFTGLFSVSHLNIDYAFWAITLPAIPIGIFLFMRKQEKEKQAWAFITLINIIYIFLPALVFRMVIYAILFSLIPISYAISHFYIIIHNKVSQSYYRIARTTFILLCCCSFLTPALLFNSKQPDFLISDKKFLTQICQYLNNNPYFEQNPRRILTSLYMGPLLLYKTRHEVIGTPSHRNVSGILDTYYVMNAQNEHDAHMIIHRRGIQVLLIGRPEYGIGDFFVEKTRNTKASGEIFHHQLWKGKVPAWLQSYPVPKSFEGKIKIFRVIG